ncbi:MAG: hypothetical protein HQL77_10695 [Magnetococcales bacterium]|nr:hypothetical protein [Magnetococcales bacterium]MBF0420723.1 hypothetical protein [Magnetococcales bacterium]MBF0435825.1 hypothetical protein [Magnetococcales bacterium]
MEVVTLYAQQASGELTSIPFSREWFEYQAFRPTDKVKDIQGFPHRTVRQFQRSDSISCDTVWVGETLHSA